LEAIVQQLGDALAPRLWSRDVQRQTAAAVLKFRNQPIHIIPTRMNREPDFIHIVFGEKVAGNGLTNASVGSSN
jgi:hypothetical protein